MVKSNRKQQPPARPAQRKSKPVPISGALIDLVAPLYDEDMPLDACKRMIGFAALAWNLSRFPVEQRSEQLRNFFKDLNLSFEEIIAAGSNEPVTESPHFGMNLPTLIKALTHRKEQLFPDDHRIVRQYDVLLENGEYRVTAGYEPAPR